MILTELMEASKERKVVERLKERKKEEYMYEVNKEIANENDDIFRDSYLEYGLQDSDYDAYIDAYAWDEQYEVFSTIRIEWNRSDYFGRVRAPLYFEDEEWHCWDSMGEDSLCE